MALPVGITPKTVTFGIPSKFNGQPATGSVTLTAPKNLVHTPTGTPLFSGSVTKQFKGVTQVEFTDLCPTDADGLNRVDWTYTLTVRVNGAVEQPEPIVFILPEAGPDEVDADLLVEVPSSAGTPVSALALTMPGGGTDGEALVKSGSSLVWATAGLTASQIAADATVRAAFALKAETPRLPGPLGGWKAKVATAPSTAKVVILGDSTSDPALNAAHIYRRLLSLHTQQGEALDGVGSSDFFTDGVGNGTTTFTSATANFTTADIGRFMHGKGFPVGTKITARASSTSVTVSTTIPSGTSLPFWVGRHVIGGGNNGKPLIDWMNSPSDGASPYNRDKLVTDAPDLTVASWLINDVRLGLLGTTVDTIVTAGTARLQAFVEWHRTTLPNTDLLLRMPNPFLTANVGSSNYVTDGSTTNPAGIAQTYSTALRRIYLGFIGRYPNVDVLDTQAEVFGTRSVATHAMMTDQIHPSGNLSGDVNLLTAVGGGYIAIADAIARRIGFARNAFPAPGATRTRHEFIVYSAPAAGQVRLLSRDYTVPASQAALSRSDSLYVNGLDSPITLTNATFDRLTNPDWLGITIGGGVTTDFTPYIGQTAMISGSHSAPTTGESTVINIDLPSIAAGATYTTTVTVSGVATGQQGHRATVLPIPGNAFGNAGLLLKSCYVSGTDTVRISVENPTAGAIDAVADNWTFLIAR